MEKPIDMEDAAGKGKQLTPEQAIAYCKKQNIKFIAFTYNEPTIWFEYGLDICKLAKENGIKVVYVSNGFMSKEAREILKDYISATNIDLKCFKNETYQRIMGGRLQEVCDNIKFFYDSKIITEVTTLIVPRMNDSEEELRDTAQFLASIGKDIPWHLSAFHPDYKMVDRSNTPVTTLEKAYQIAKQAGLINVYCGNVRTDHTNTVCPKCQEILVNRSGYNVKPGQIQQGCCKKCG